MVEVKERRPPSLRSLPWHVVAGMVCQLLGLGGRRRGEIMYIMVKVYLRLAIEAPSTMAAVCVHLDYRPQAATLHKDSPSIH